jgi:hypothetical protein
MAAPWWSRVHHSGGAVRVRSRAQAESPSPVIQRPHEEGTAVDEERGEEVRRQALFREVNEQIEKLSDGWELFDGSLSVLCECGRPGCNEAIDVPRTLYDDIRAASNRFLLKLGHEIEDVDDVVARNDGYVIVERGAEAQS